MCLMDGPLASDKFLYKLCISMQHAHFVFVRGAPFLLAAERRVGTAQLGGKI